MGFKKLKPFTTPKGIFEKGMFVCSDCGGLCSIDSAKCKCGEVKFIIVK